MKWPTIVKSYIDPYKRYVHLIISTKEDIIKLLKRKVMK